MVELVYTGDLKSPGDSLTGSSPVSGTIKGLLAQLVEHRTFNPQVLGSSPRQSTFSEVLGT